MKHGTLTTKGNQVELRSHGARTWGRYTAGTRTIHAHGGKRLERAGTS